MMMSVVSKLLLMSTSCSGAWSIYEYSLMALMRSEMRAVLCSSSSAMRSISRSVPNRVSSGPSEVPASTAKLSNCASVRFASGNAQALQTIPECRSRAASGGRRIVQLVGESGRQFSQRGQFFVLLFRPRDVSNAIRQQSNEALGELGHSLKKLRKLAGGKHQHANRKYRASGHAIHFHSGKRQDAGDLAGASCKNRAILRTILPPGAQFSFEHH